MSDRTTRLPEVENALREGVVEAVRGIVAEAYDEYDECRWCRLPIDDDHRPDCPVALLLTATGQVKS